MPESHEFHEFDELDEVASEYFPSLEERLTKRGLTREQALDIALQNLSEYVKLSQTAKQCGMNSSDERHLRVFNALCEMGYADGCSDRNILLNNLACIGGMIAEFPFLEPVAPLVYYQVCTEQPETP